MIEKYPQLLIFFLSFFSLRNDAWKCLSPEQDERIRPLVCSGILIFFDPNLCLQNFDFTYFFLFSDEGRGSIYIFGGYTDRYKVKYI